MRVEERSMPLRSSAVFITVILFAQLNAQGVWQLKASVDHLRCTDPIGADHRSRTGRPVFGMGGHFGVGYEQMASRTVGVRAELLANMRRSGYDLALVDLPYRSPTTEALFTYAKRTMQLVQVEVPVLVVLRQWSLLRVDAGVSTAYMVAAHERITGSAEEGIRKEVADRTGSMPAMEMSLIIGAEVESDHRVGMGVRYRHGLTDLDRMIGAAPSLPRTWQVSVSYVLGAKDLDR